MVGAEGRHQIVDQALVRHPVAAQSENRSQKPVQRARAEGRERDAETLEVSLAFPPPPQHPQMREVQFVWKKPQDGLRVKIPEIEAMGRRRVGADKKRQKVFHNLHHEVADTLLVRGGEFGSGARHQGGQAGTAQADVRAVVGQARIGHRRQGDQVPRQDTALAQFSHGVQATARQHFMA